MKTITTTFISGASCFILLLHPGTLNAVIEHSRDMDTAKKCAICHYRWVYTFYVANRGTPLAPLEKEMVVGKQEMCFSCHDGSVRDSRDRICNDPGHSVGNIPSARIAVPETFPLDENGAMQCATCHTPHAMTREETPKVEYFLRVPNVNSSICKMCHVEHVGGTQTGNHPIDISVKYVPEDIVKSGGMLGTEPKNHIICQTCHVPHGGVNNKFLVLSIEDPKTRSVLCEVCHTSKPGLAVDPSLNRFSHPMDVTPGHPEKILPKWENGKDVIFGIGGELVCRTCHVPHRAVDNSALLVEPNHKDSICVQCHKVKLEIVGTRHDVGYLSPDEVNILGEKAADLGPCSPCHLVHHGSGELMWARKKVNQAQRPGEFCMNCHYPGGIAENVMPAEYSHPMGIPFSAKTATLTLPFFDNNGINPKGEMRCGTCHDFHSPSPVNSDPLQNGAKHAKFLRMPEEENSGFCANCHLQHGLIEGTDHDLRMSAPAFKNSSGQTASDANSPCTPCHAVHNAQEKKFLWAAPRGPVILEGWNEAYTGEQNLMVTLCTGCHSPGKIADSHIPLFGLHPMEEYIEGRPRITFELVNGEFPIFTDMGDISPFGNLVCSTCHNPHQWNPSMDLKGPGRETEGNVADSFLRPKIYSKLCTGCHGRDGLVRFQYFHRSIGRLQELPPFPFDLQ